MTEETTTVEVEEVAEPVVQSRGTKETQEVIKALEVLAEFATKMFADGKVDGSDFMLAIEFFKKADVMVDAIKDIDELAAEIKDLDEQELIQLGLASYSLVKKIVAAVKLAKA